MQKTLLLLVFERIYKSKFKAFKKECTKTKIWLLWVLKFKISLTNKRIHFHFCIFQENYAVAFRPVRQPDRVWILEEVSCSAVSMLNIESYRKECWKEKATDGRVSGKTAE